MRSNAAGAALLVAAACFGSARPALAFCRTSTCPLPPDFSPVGESCKPQDFAAECAALNPPAKDLPLWWRNTAVSYDVFEDTTSQGQALASKGLSFDVVNKVVDDAFAAWTATTCVDLNSGQSLPVSIEATNLGAVSCSKVQYNLDQGNQHAIILREVWPYDTPGANPSAISANTLGLTTVTFDATTGEIFDADTEINASVPLTMTTPVPPGSFDLASIVTHEMGHFLGLAHSGTSSATMYARYTPGSIMMRNLTDDDRAGLCQIAPPVSPGASGAVRSVDPSVSPGGTIQAGPNDPTPRHGFSAQCAQPLKHGCAVAAADGSQGPATLLAGVLGAVAVGGGWRRRRAARAGAAVSR